MMLVTLVDDATVCYVDEVVCGGADDDVCNVILKYQKLSLGSCSETSLNGKFQFCELESLNLF